MPKMLPQDTKFKQEHDSEIKPKQLLQEAAVINQEKKSNSKAMNQIATDVAKVNGIDKSILIHNKDYLHYRGRGWVDGDPLEKEPETDFPDRVSPTFKKLIEIIDDMAAIGKLDQLQVYLDAAKLRGVDIIISDKETQVDDVDDVWHAVNVMSNYQTTICELADEIKLGCAEVSEEIGFTPKEEFKPTLDFYEKVSEEKDVDDKYQDKVTDLNMVETAWNSIYDGQYK